MPSEWHEKIKRLFEKVGNQLGFDSKAEFRIPKGYIDCVWKLEKPVSEIFIAFEFETAIAGSQIVENLVKSLSLPPQMKPRFLVQIYKNKLKFRTREYIEKIARTLPVTVKIIDDVGGDPEKACESIVIDLFNWIEEYAEIPRDFLEELGKVIPNEKIIKVFHYGEPTRSHLQYLDNAIRKVKDYLLWIKSVPAEKDRDIISDVFEDIMICDIAIISDVDIKYCDRYLLQKFLDENVEKRGKSLILTGGYGLTKKYNEIREKLGGKIGKRSGESVKITKSRDNIGVGLTFNGFNYFKPSNYEEVVAFWNKDDLPALITHRLGKGNVIIFTSDCSPAWGTPSIQTEEFKEMWKTIIEKYCIKNQES